MANALDWPRPVRRIITLVLVVGVFTGIFFLGRFLLTSPAFSFGKKTLQKLSVSSSMEIHPFGSDLVFRDGDTLKRLNPKNEIVWTYPLDNPNLRYSVENQHIALWNGKLLNVLDESGKSLYAPVPLQDEIHMARCGFNATVILLGDQDMYLQVVNREGTVIETQSFKQKQPLDMRFYSRDDLLWYAYMETNSSVPISTVKTIQPSKSDTGLMTDSDQILYKAIFNVNLNEIAIVGTRTLTFCNQNLEPSASRAPKQIYGYQLVDYRARKDATCLLFAPSAQAGEQAMLTDIRMFQGNREMEIRLPKECLAVFCGEKAIYAVSSRTVYSYAYPPVGKALGKPRLTNLPVAADKATALLDGDRLVLSAGDSVYLLPM